MKPSPQRKTRDTRDPRDVPVYSLAEAAIYLGVHPRTLSNWTRPSTKKTIVGPRDRAPLIEPARREGRNVTLSFWNLTEAFIVRTMQVRYGLDKQAIQETKEWAHQELNIIRPFIDERFLTNGCDLFLDLPKGGLTNVTQGGQLPLPDFLKGTLERIEVDERSLVARLFPWRRSLEEPKLMVIDPEVSYGRPVLVGTRIPSATLFQRNQAGDDIAELAQDFQLEERRVQEAIQWEAEAREEAKAA